MSFFRVFLSRRETLEIPETQMEFFSDYGAASLVCTFDETPVSMWHHVFCGRTGTGIMLEASQRNSNIYGSKELSLLGGI
jgi:hypothetical protein